MIKRYCYIFILLILCLTGKAQNPFNFLINWDYNNTSTGLVLTNDTIMLTNTIEDVSGMYSSSYLLLLNENVDSLKGYILQANYIGANQYMKAGENRFVSTGYISNDGQDYDVLLSVLNKQTESGEIKRYGGSQIDIGKDIINLSDNGYLIVGYTESFGEGSQDIYLIRTDDEGDTLWTKTYGDFLSQSAFAIEKQNDSIFVIAGKWGNAATNSGDVFIMKIDLDGDTLDFALYDTYNLQNFGHCLAKTSDSGYVVAGVLEHMYPNYIGFMPGIYKVDRDLNLQWAKYYGNPYEGEAFDIKECYDKGFIMVGYLEMQGSDDVYIVRTDSLGDTLWTRILGGNDLDRAKSVIQTQDSGFAVSGYTRSFGANGLNGFFLKLNADGELTVNLGLAPMEPALQISTFPNPVSDKLNVHFKQEQSGVLHLYTMAGKELYRKVISRTMQTEIDVNHFPAGTYILSFVPENKENVQSLTVVKE